MKDMNIINHMRETVVICESNLLFAAGQMCGGNSVLNARTNSFVMSLTKLQMEKFTMLLESQFVIFFCVGGICMPIKKYQNQLKAIKSSIYLYHLFVFIFLSASKPVV